MNYEDPRIKALEEEKANKLATTGNEYEGMLDQHQDFLDKSNAWQDEYLDKQNELLDRGTELTTQKIEKKQKEQEESYKKESIASEADYQDFINPYGVQAEKTAEAGLSGAEGYSESTKARAYNTARIRTAIAKSTMQKINAEFDIAKQEAKLSNDSEKVRLALEVLKGKLANEANYLNVSTSLKESLLSRQDNIDSTFYGRIQDILDQQRYEQEREEEARRYEEQLAYQKDRDRIADSQWQKQYNLSAQKAAEKKQQEIDLYNTNSNTPISNNVSHIARELINYGSEGKLNKNAIINSVNSYYQKGKLTEQEVNYIFDQLGIE